jgi:murein DD-endopeptidase MepM/ murein hydrolase activator NlpD
VIQAWLLRQAPYLIIVVGVILLGYWIGSTLIERGRNEIRPQLEKLELELATERTNRARAEAASSAYSQELADLNRRPVRTSPVRLCVSPPAVPASQSSSGTTDTSPTTGSDAGSAGGDLAAGPDIGPALRSLALACDMENAKLRALQGWANGLD